MDRRADQREVPRESHDHQTQQQDAGEGAEPGEIASVVPDQRPAELRGGEHVRQVEGGRVQEAAEERERQPDQRQRGQDQ